MAHACLSKPALDHPKRMLRLGAHTGLELFDTGERCLVLDGPTVTARRMAAVSVLAAQRLAPSKQVPVLIVGAGVQGSAHLQAFAEGLGLASFSLPRPVRPVPWF